MTNENKLNPESESSLSAEAADAASEGVAASAEAAQESQEAEGDTVDTGSSEAVSAEAEAGETESLETASNDVVADEDVVASEAAVADEDAGTSEEEAGTDPVDEELDYDDPALDEVYGDDYIDEDEDENEDAVPLESLVEESAGASDELDMDWYILKVQVNRETSICEALRRRVSVAGLDGYFSDILVPTEDVREFTKSGKQRIIKRKLYPGYVVVRMAINDESWFLVRETPGIGDFTGAAGKPAPLTPDEIERILKTTRPSKEETAEENVKTAIKYKVGDRVRVKEGNFQNYEGDVSNIDERNGRVTVMINIFNRPNPVELDHWQVEEFE